ncbi:hypothetical protein DMC25_06380 [Caulobacter sp. D4A]|uniref:hypothetical protein n=1 Tax=unclassified Caulobacter TaxID=2648921 RepID=UPI000D73CFD3|nr:MULTISPECIES: hypothetical protein [unclassified Caulobacter]PXA91176.1 hypothetical protein DMC25_06380 [Caulobacter sp. D4A]PXA96803.1 hypothetical protein DMC18_00640 [Caulobacter sp. D5]
MADLARAPTRRTAAERLTKNTDTVLPRSRITDMAAPQVRADMRSAYRGNDVDEVRRALGMVTDGVAAVADLTQQQHFEKEKAQAQQAVADEATGKINAEAAKKSEAYAQVIATSAARRTASDLEAKAKLRIQALMADGEHDLDDVNAALDEVFKPALFEADGKTAKDYGTPEANTALYQALGEVRLGLHAEAQQVIAQQVQTKGLAGVADMVALDAKKGLISIEAGIARAGELGIDPVAAKRELLPALVNTAIQTDNPDLLLKAADSRKADGSRTWSTAEENSLRDQALTLKRIVDAKNEKAAADRSAATLGTMAVKVQQGFKITPAFVQQQIDSGAIRPQDAQDLFRVQEHRDDEERQKIAQRRQDISWAQGQEDRRLALIDRAEARAARASVKAANDVLVGLYSKGASPAQAQRAAAKLYGDRKINGDTFRTLTEEIGQMPGDASVVSRVGAQDYEYTLKDIYAQSNAYAGQPGRPSAAQLAEQSQAAQLSFYRALRTGSSPAEALRAGLTAGGFQKSFVDARVAEARARDMSPTISDQKKK